MQVERESGGDLARAFDKDEDDERVVTILFFLMELPLAALKESKNGENISLHLGEF